MIHDFESPPPPQSKCPICADVLDNGSELGELECQYYHPKTGIMVEMLVKFHDDCVERVGQDSIVQEAMDRAKAAVEEEWLRNNHPHRYERANMAQYN